MGNVGPSTLVTHSQEGAVLGRECALIRPTNSKLIGAWVYTWTQSTQFREQARRHTSGTTMQMLSHQALATFTIPVPPLEHQREAEQQLQKIDDALARVDEMRSDLAELRAVQMDLLVADIGGGA